MTETSTRREEHSGGPAALTGGTPPLAARLFLLLEDPSHFGRYLSRLDPEARAGEPRDGRSCPLARFLNTMARAGAPLEVGAERVFLLEAGPTGVLPVARLPYWAQAFVARIDDAPRRQPAAPVGTPAGTPDGPSEPGRLTAPVVHGILDAALLDALLY